jgi:argonaute-like protein implicated in RNA metabolism and viral defense
MTQEVSDRMDKIQSDMHKIVNEIYATRQIKSAQYSDFVTAYLIRKIAEIEINLERLERNHKTLKSVSLKRG